MFVSRCCGVFAVFLEASRSVCELCRNLSARDDSLCRVVLQGLTRRNATACGGVWSEIYISCLLFEGVAPMPQARRLPCSLSAPEAPGADRQLPLPPRCRRPSLRSRMSAPGASSAPTALPQTLTPPLPRVSSGRRIASFRSHRAVEDPTPLPCVIAVAPMAREVVAKWATARSAGAGAAHGLGGGWGGSRQRAGRLRDESKVCRGGRNLRISAIGDRLRPVVAGGRRIGLPGGVPRR